MAGAYCQTLEGERGGAMTQVLEEDTTPKTVSIVLCLVYIVLCVVYIVLCVVYIVLCVVGIV